MTRRICRPSDRHASRQGGTILPDEPLHVQRSSSPSRSLLCSVTDCLRSVECHKSPSAHLDTGRLISAWSTRCNRITNALDEHSTHAVMAFRSHASLCTCVSPGEALETADISKFRRGQDLLRKLRAFSMDKIDFATAHLLSHWDIFSGGHEVRAHPKTGERRTTSFSQDLVVEEVPKRPPPFLTP